MPTGNSWENAGVFNPAVTMWDNRIMLIYRGQNKEGISKFGRVLMRNMTEVSERDLSPVFEPDPNNEYETFGIEDPRITQIGEDYWMAYIGASHYPPLQPELKPRLIPEWRVRVKLAKTTDFKTWDKFGVVISHIDSKDAALFPEKLGGNYLLIHRVVPQLRIATSGFGQRFKERGPIFGPRKGDWDSVLVGLGAPPIKSPFGWILFYHGVDENKIYRLGVALLDAKDPTVVLGRSKEPVLEPQEDWEKMGQVPNVVFTCGAIELNDKYWIYYGGADTVIGAAYIDKNELWGWAKKVCLTFSQL